MIRDGTIWIMFQDMPGEALITDRTFQGYTVGNMAVRIPVCIITIYAGGNFFMVRMDATGLGDFSEGGEYSGFCF
jgi:hypothetical protein